MSPGVLADAIAESVTWAKRPRILNDRRRLGGVMAVGPVDVKR
jgi:hypothetical protein